MPEPIKSGRRYMPGLDGLRAVAVLGVIVYHLGFKGLPGGFLGVSVFFTLSGYLITDLILTKTSERSFTLKEFWIARARRLVPGLMLMLVVVMAWVTVIGPHQKSDFRLAALGAVFYVNNWWWVFHHVSYFAQFGGPSPINHLWSLSVEEQFYILWPLLVVVGARLIPEREPGINRPRLGLVIGGLAIASFVAMQVMFHPGADPSRVYYGTDTRAAELLVGAVLATLWPSQKLRARIAADARNLIDGVAVVGLGVILLMFWKIKESSTFLYRGGFMVLGLAVVAVVASVAHPACRLGAVIGCKPMRWIGARSYGIYLWHFPIIVLTAPSEGGSPTLARATAQLASTLVVAALSWKFFEDPIRHGAIGRLWPRWRERWEQRPVNLTPVGVGAIAGIMIVLAPAVAGFAGVGIDRTESLSEAAGLEVTKTVGDATTETTDPATDSAPDGASDSAPDSAPDNASDSTIAGGASATSVVSTDAAPAADAKTLCTSVVHLGDSTSIGLVSKSFIHDESQQISGQYSAIGITTQHYDILGGRSILEGYKTNPPAKVSAQKFRDQDYHGCWVVGIGLADAAAIYRYDKGGARKRIDTLMAIVGNDPVMWINVRTIANSGLAQKEVGPPWNQALVDACPAYPNMRVYDWAATEQDNWFDKDRVHNNSVGYIAKAKSIAAALAKAFPPGGAVDRPAGDDNCVIEIPAG